MKVWIDADEWYPFFNVFLEPDSVGREYEVDEDLVKRYRRAVGALQKVSDELEKAIGWNR